MLAQAFDASDKWISEVKLLDGVIGQQGVHEETLSRKTNRVEKKQVPILL